MDDTKATAQLVTLRDARSSAAEAYRSLRTNIMFSSLEQPVSTLLLTSCASGRADADEKSAVLANLAVTFAQGGHRTILVDADLRRPRQHELWGLSNEHGLTTMMLEEGALAEPPIVETGVEDLFVLPSGPLPAIPADVIGSQRMGDVAGVLKARASFILYDAPPILAATDALLLGSLLDGVVLSLRSGVTRREDALRAREALERVHARILGTVLTNAPREMADRGYGSA
ncbi:MAG: CpsD/CapB family tyrosine-protein kinase [Anaerolineaceae bacterium]|nr:CpsD/CapB family tyrosine-protein kinase [Anaerolineaceae bacterium]